MNRVLLSYLFTNKWYFTFFLVILNLSIYLFRFVKYRSLTEYITELSTTKPINTTGTLIMFFVQLTGIHVVHIVTSYFLRKEIVKRVNCVFNDLVKKMIRYKLDFYDFYGKEQFINVWSYLYNIEKLVKEIIMQVPEKIIYIAYYSYSIYKFSPVALLIIFFLKLIILYGLHPLSKKQYQYQKDRVKLDMETKTRYLELVNNISHIKLSTTEDHETDRILSSYENYNINKSNDEIVSYFLSILTDTISDSVMFVIYIVGATYVISSSMKPIELLYLAVHTSRLYEKIKGFKDIFDDYNKMLPKIKVLIGMLSYKGTDCGPDKDVNLNDTIQLIQFDNIHFSYGETKILNGISFSLLSKGINLIVGPNGSGKSTMLSLMLKLYTDYSGTIKLMGHDIKNIPTKQIRRTISVIHQDAMLFNETLMYNVCYGGNYEYSKVLELAKEIEFDNFLENNKDMIIGHMGDKLSGGEKKKVQILNSLLKNSEVLVFDEPTNSLDIETCEWLVNFIRILKEKLNKSIIIVSHDKRLISLADNLIELTK